MHNLYSFVLFMITYSVHYCIFLMAFVYYISGLLKQILQWAQQYRGGIYCLWIGPFYPLVLMYKPELIEVSTAVIISP